MKASLVPIYFKSGDLAPFNKQLTILKKLFSGQADFKEPVPLGGRVPETDAVIFPEFLGEAYKLEWE